MLVTTIFVLIAALAYLICATPMFTSTSRLYINKQNPKIVGEAEQMLVDYKDYLNTQAELLKSVPILSATLDKPGIKEMKTFFDVPNLIEYLNKKVNISVGKKDDIISVSFDSPYPLEAAQLVNCLVDSYISYQSLQKRNKNAEILKILQKERVRREEELNEKLEAMTQYRKKYGIPTIENRSFMYDELYRLHLQLADLSRFATEEHPAVVSTRKRIELILEQYNSITEYAVMQSDWESAKERCDILDNRIEELSATEDTGALSISILEIAQPADKPSKPQKARVMAIALVLGLMLGGALAMLRDFMDHKFHSTDEVDAALGIPVLGLVPSMSQDQSVSERGQNVHLDSSSQTAEAYRTIRTAVFFGVPPSKAKTLLVTSPVPGEGKSTLISNLAIAMAQAGQKTLVLDADFRKPMQHSIFKIGNDIGLSSVLIEATTLEGAIHTNVINGLDILTTGPIVPNPSEILNSETFAGILSKLAGEYDRILIDSPPSLPVTDAQILAALSDITLLVIKADYSTRRTSLQARDNLLSVGAKLLGTIINGVSKKNGQYGYYSKYGSYGNNYYGHGHKDKHRIRITDIKAGRDVHQSQNDLEGSKRYSAVEKES
jgi:capsular exopolysaccharide synthesis family protein